MTRKTRPTAFLERACWHLFLWLVPRIDLAAEKRNLERIAQDCGASRSSAKAIANRYFERLLHKS